MDPVHGPCDRKHNLCRCPPPGLVVMVHRDHLDTLLIALEEGECCKPRECRWQPSSSLPASLSTPPGPRPHPSPLEETLHRRLAWLNLPRPPIQIFFFSRPKLPAKGCWGGWLSVGQSHIHSDQPDRPTACHHPMGKSSGHRSSQAKPAAGHEPANRPTGLAKARVPENFQARGGSHHGPGRCRKVSTLLATGPDGQLLRPRGGS